MIRRFISLAGNHASLRVAFCAGYAAWRNLREFTTSMQRILSAALTATARFTGAI